jgi:general secretion pathway protein F
MPPIFEYKALDAGGKTSKGVIEADSAKSARLKLKKQNLMVTEMDERSVATQKKAGGFANLFKRVSLKDTSLMARQLASLVKANIPLVDCLTALVDQTDNPKLKVILSQVRQDVNEGSSLAKATGAHPQAFDNTFVNMIDAGESSGTLGLVLVRLADLKEAQMRLRSKVVSGMTYPMLMVAVAGILIVGIFTFVIPKLTQIFESTNKPLPITTKALIFVSGLLINYWFVFVGAFVGGFIIFNRYIATPHGKARWDAFKLKAPIFGNLVRLIAVTRFTRTMATLLGSGVPIITAMTISKNVVGNIPIANAITKAQENITEGQSIADPLKKSGEFPPLVIHMIAIGEKTGELPDMLRNVAETYEEQVSVRIEGLASLLEPLMLIAMGLVVGFIVFSIFMPLMELTNITTQNK